MNDFGGPDRSGAPEEDQPRGALAQFGRDALGDLGDELKIAVVTILFVGAGAGIGYAVGQGDGAIIGGIAGAALLGLIGVVVLVRWALGTARDARRRMRSR